MYSGLLPKGLSEAELSSDGDDEVDASSQNDAQSKVESKCFDGPPPVLQKHEGVEAEHLPRSNAISEKDPDCSLPGISQGTWQKFKDLQKKRDEAKTAAVPPRRRKRRKRHKKDTGSGTESLESNKEREQQGESEKHWDGLKQYFGVNDRFQPPACSKPAPKCGLEKSIESAIAKGDFATAEELSDRLATRELAVKIVEAADCRDFVQSKQEAEASRAAQKRKKQIAWGFEAKKRWETKSNMGFM